MGAPCTQEALTPRNASALTLVLEFPDGDTLRAAVLAGRVTAESSPADTARGTPNALNGLRLAGIGYADSLHPLFFQQGDSVTWAWTAGFMHYGTFAVSVETDSGFHWDTSGVQVSRTDCFRPATARLTGRLSR